MTVTSLRLPEPPRPDAEERLAFAEQLLACEGPEACARACLEWLGAHGGIEQGLCAAIDLHSGPGHLRGLAQLGLPEGTARAFSLDATREDHPLVAALSADGPVPVDGAHVPIPTEQAPSIALPLGRRGERAVGLLLVRGAEPLSPRVAWAARLTGERLSGLHAHRVLAEERVLRERAVLAGLVAALPVPVVLYDVEGRRVLGNARADWLLTAHEDDASRRARAAALNQTRLSTLLRKARPGSGVPAEVTLADPAEGGDLRFELTTLEVEGADGRPGTLVLLREGGRAEVQGEGAETLRAARAEAWSERHRMDVILDSVADPVLVSGPGGDVVLMNAPAERLFVVPPGGGPDAERRVRANDAYFASFVAHLVCA
ncbi:MAG TPA: histidine kinase, partial [Myxococcaceae bacterium]|nr:histidine kinase [Myxococcaceae bacterium]